MVTQSLLYSNDGTTWTNTPSPFDSNPGVSPAQGWAVRWGNFVNPSSVHIQKFLAATSSGAPSINGPAQLCTSTDGITWTAATGSGTTAVQSPMYPLGAVSDGSTIPSGSGGFYNVGNAGSPGTASNDGLTFPISVADPTGGDVVDWDRQVIFGGGTWVVGDALIDEAYTSTNLGGSWGANLINGGTANEVGFIAYDGSTQFVTGLIENPGATEMATSPDGVTWTDRQNSASATVCEPFSGAYSPSLGLWVVGGTQMTDHTGTATFHLMTSPDGHTWTGHADPWAGFFPLNMCWSTAHNLFCAVFGTGMVSTSSNGTSWTNATLPFSANNAYDVAVSPSLSRFVIACTCTVTITPPPPLGGSWLASTAP